MDNAVVQHFEFSLTFKDFHVDKNTENWIVVKA